MRTHNLVTVVAFEVRRTLAKPMFWIASLSVPLFMAFVFGLSFFSGMTAAESAVRTDEQPTAFTYTDASGIVVPEVAASLGGSPATDAAAAAQAVRDGRAELFIAVPADPVADGIHLIGRDLGLMESTRWSVVAQNLLRLSAQARVGDPQLTGALRGVEISVELWADGQRSPGWSAAVLPGLFLLALFLAVVLLGQQMLNITVEEKENRVTEMILTTIHPGTLIMGKVAGVVIVGLIQGAVLLLPMLAISLIPGLLPGSGAGDAGTTPAAVGDLSLDLPRILLGAVLFLASFLLFVGLLVAIGAVMPTAKDAGSAFAVVVIGMFLPLYALPLVMQVPDSPTSQVLTYFPLTAPVMALTRNALGSLSPGEAALVLAILVASATLALRIGVRLFREGSIAYDKRLSLRRIWRPASRTAA